MWLLVCMGKEALGLAMCRRVVACSGGWRCGEWGGGAHEVAGGAGAGVGGERGDRGKRRLGFVEVFGLDA